MQGTRSLGLMTMVLALAMAVGPARGQTVPPQAGWSDRVPRVEGARHHFVGAEGKAGNPGTKEAPWDLPSALHPTIPVHAPLVFDLIDLWSGRSIGGCTYHVSHPGGRNFKTAPVNAQEAEGRRLARFQPFGHTPGMLDCRDPPANSSFPFTLDLRRV